MSFGHALLLAGVAEPSFTLGSPPVVTFIQEIPRLAHLSLGLALHVTMQLEYCLWRLHKKLVLFSWDQMLTIHSHGGQDQLPMCTRFISYLLLRNPEAQNNDFIIISKFSGLKQL